MPFDTSLADRVRPLLQRMAGFSEKTMFGGVAFLRHGNMCVGVWKEFLILRLGPEAGDAALVEPNIRPFDVTGRPMRGWVMAAPEAIESREELERYVESAVEFVATLSPKEAKAAKSARGRTKKSRREN